MRMCSDFANELSPDLARLNSFVLESTDWVISGPLTAKLVAATVLISRESVPRMGQHWHNYKAPPK